jgi:hypothetical protein
MLMTKEIPFLRSEQGLMTALNESLQDGNTIRATMLKKSSNDFHLTFI